AHGPLMQIITASHVGYWSETCVSEEDFSALSCALLALAQDSPPRCQVYVCP
ncbi:hypothetical protein KIPB_014924, partial [Kipferlia bialata]